MTETASLSVVVPAHNAGRFLSATLAALCDGLPETTEIIVVDDHSTDDTPAILRAFSERHPQVRSTRCDSNVGAGNARNIGFEQATGDFTWFFDADDIPFCDAVRALLSDPAARAADVIVAQYDTRNPDNPRRRGMMRYDTAFWDAVRDKELLNGITTGRALPEVFPLTNYPWMKLIRTGIFRERGLRFSGTRVGNDIFAHWFVLCEAGSIFLSDKVICEHLYHGDGRQITARFGEERLDMFVALNETWDYLESHADTGLEIAEQFVFQSANISDWALDRMDPEVAPRARAACRDLFLRIGAGHIVRSLPRFPQEARYALRARAYW